MDYVKQSEFHAAKARKEEARHLLLQLQGVGASKEDIDAAKDLCKEAHNAEDVAWKALHATFISVAL